MSLYEFVFRADVVVNLVFHDNGCGMDKKLVENYAIYSYGVKAREKDAGKKQTKRHEEQERERELERKIERTRARAREKLFRLVAYLRA